MIFEEFFVELYEYYDRDATLVASTDTLMKIAQGINAAYNSSL